MPCSKKADPPILRTRDAQNFGHQISPNEGLVDIANSQMKLYSSIIRAVTDGCAIKDSKNNLQRIQRANQG